MDEVAWSRNLMEAAADLEQRREELERDQERWAEWHALQEQALLEQIRQLEAREEELARREMILGDAFRSLEKDAIELDRRRDLLEQEREAMYRRHRGYETPPEDDFSDDTVPMVMLNSSATRLPPPSLPENRPPTRRKAGFTRGLSERYSPSQGAFEVRVDSPDNTKVHVTYVDPAHHNSASSSGFGSLMRATEGYAPPPRGKVQAGTQAAAETAALAKIKAFKDSIFPSCVNADDGADDDDDDDDNNGPQRPLKIAEIIRSGAPPPPPRTAPQLSLESRLNDLLWKSKRS